MELLDLSARNRLLNVPRFSKSAKTIDIVDEKSSEIYRLLVNEGKAFTFLAGKPDRPKAGQEAAADDEIDYSPISLAQPEDDGVDDRGISTRHSDTKLQTRMTPTGLQRRLLDLYHDARTLEEEQGVNVLFLALGMLKWVDPNNKENIRQAPLILVPVRLERGTAGEKFRLRARPEDQSANLSLELYLDRMHKLAMMLEELRRTWQLGSPRGQFPSALTDQLLQARDRLNAHAQVGIAGFFIDLAVADPERPGRYLLGIECDGAEYHSSRSARDRDRLRLAVLEDHVPWIA